MQIFAFLLARLSEPSSYAGLGAILAMVGLHLSDSDIGQLAGLLAAACGFVAVVLKERGLAPAIVLCVGLGAALAGCAPLVGAGAATGALGGGLAIIDRITGTVDTTIQTACREYQKGKSAANTIVGTGVLPAAVTRKLAIIEEYGDAACAKPPAGDVLSTAIWLGELVGQIATLTTPQPAT